MRPASCRGVPGSRAGFALAQRPPGRDPSALGLARAGRHSNANWVVAHWRPKREGAEADFHLLEAPSQGVDLPWLGDTRSPVTEALIPTRQDAQRSHVVIAIRVGETSLDQSTPRQAEVTPFGAEPIDLPTGPVRRIAHRLFAHPQVGTLSITTVPVQMHDIRTAMPNLLPLPVDGIICRCWLQFEFARIWIAIVD